MKKKNNLFFLFSDSIKEKLYIVFDENLIIINARIMLILVFLLLFIRFLLFSFLLFSRIFAYVKNWNLIKLK